ncbi:MAG: J domain-containing protein, partial [Asticcacaulis sp.]
GGGRSGGANARFDGVDLEDIFDIFGGAGMGGQARSRGGFGGGPGGGPGGGMGGGPAKGADIKASLDIELFDTILGNTRRVVFSDGRTVDVTIPKGATDGQTLRLRGQGSMGRHGLAGDALITLKLRPHPVFSPDGADLYMDLAVSLPDAVLGGKVEAPTPDGPVSITVPKYTQSGAMLRLKGRGGYDTTTTKRGDLFARLIVALPDGPDPRLEALADTMRQEGGYVPKPLKPVRR